MPLYDTCADGANQGHLYLVVFILFYFFLLATYFATRCYTYAFVIFLVYKTMKVCPFEIR